MDPIQNTSSVRQYAMRVVFTLILAVYLTTPALTVLDLSGNIDAVSSAILITGISFFLFLAGKNIGAILVSLLAIGSILFNLGSSSYHSLQQFYPTKNTIYLLPEIGSLIKSYEISYLFLFAVALLLTFTIFVYISRKAHLNNPALLVSFGTASILSFVGLQLVYTLVTKEERFYQSSVAPIGHLVRSTQVFPFVKFDPELEIQIEREALVKKLSDNPSLSLPEKFSVNNIGDLLGESEGFHLRSTNPRYPLYRSGSWQDKSSSNSTVSAPKKSAPETNVILLVLESVRASEMGLYGADYSATPFLDSLGKNAIFANKFYSTSNFTVKSEHAIHCSTYDYMIGAPVSNRDIPVRTQCLPKMLAEKGYETAWFHGNTSEFYGRSGYLPKIGFKSVFSLDELTRDSSLPKLGWGIKDPVLFDTALNTLETIKKPFYAEILSVSNHMPFDFEWGIDFPAHLQNTETMHDNYRRGIYYTDRAVALFYEKFKKSKLADNTILVVTGDHGIWTFSNETTSPLLKNEQFFRVPLIVELPDNKNIEINNIHSHLDIAPTLFELLGLTGANDFIGQSIFSKNEKKSNRMLYLMTEQALSYRTVGKACIPDTQCQNSINCYQAFEEEPSKNQCYQFNPAHDLLSNSEDVTSLKDFISLTERALFDYSQIAIELGTVPDSKIVNSPIAKTDE